MALPYLNTLNLRNNTIIYFPWYCLKNMSKLVHLDLSHNQLFCVNLYPVKSLVPNLQRVDISYNNINTLSMCDLGWDMRVPNGNHIQYEPIIAGNPFHCDCDIDWVIHLAIIAAKCRNKTSRTCVSFLGENAVLRAVSKDQSLFRCKTPSRVENVGLHRLNRYMNISGCYAFWDPTGVNSTIYLPEPCDPYSSCPKERQDLRPSEKRKLQQAEIFQISQNVTDDLKVTPQTQDSPTPHPVAMASGLPALVVGVVSLVCVLMVAAYSAKGRKKHDHKHATNDPVNMASGLAVNNGVNQNVHADVSANIARDNDQEGCRDHPNLEDSCMQKTLPDSIEPYAETFGYDVPQYGLEDVRIVGKHG
uniref:LRRCT domain-containing protein n=1 Tax=Branchiostoma floridae TaxID=7739 RepID=C3YT04_BRAFL|eukprot:XP_002600560.1 hypothetical protein BRAFLDRAFT_70062 [Branchiostoma floridae]